MRYVQRRDTLARGAALDGAGKRAAFALFYGPLHLRVVEEIARSLGAPAPPRLVDLGCGTGAASAGWRAAGGAAGDVERAGGAAGSASGRATIEGVDVNAWALAEARRTWDAFGLEGRTRRGDLARARPSPAGGAGALAAWAINELDDARREAMLAKLVAFARHGGAVLVVEPVARRAAPWWDDWVRAFRPLGGADDERAVEPALPDAWWELDRAARLDHRRVKARALWCAGNG